MHQNQNNEIPNPIAELQKKLKQAEKIISALMYRVEKSSLIYESDYSYFESIAILNETIDKTQEKINQITQELYEKESKLEHEVELCLFDNNIKLVLYIPAVYSAPLLIGEAIRFASVAERCGLALPKQRGGAKQSAK